MPNFSPTFLKKDPATGLTFYDFDGHIKARGLDLGVYSSAARVPPPPQNSEVRWVRDDSGTLGAKIRVSEGTIGPNGTTQMRATVTNEGQNHTADALLLNSDNVSDFLRLEGPVPLTLSANAFSYQAVLGGGYGTPSRFSLTLGNRRIHFCTGLIYLNTAWNPGMWIVDAGLEVAPTDGKMIYIQQTSAGAKRVDLESNGIKYQGDVSLPAGSWISISGMYAIYDFT